MSPGQCMMAREIIPREWMTHVLTVNGADDYFLWLLMLDKGIGFHYVDEPLYIHHRTGENVSGNIGQTEESTAQFMHYLSEMEYPPRPLAQLNRQVRYKQEFRSGDFGRKSS